jgi:hypothetical protein
MSAIPIVTNTADLEEEIEELTRTQKQLCRCRIAHVDTTAAEQERDRALQHLIAATESTMEDRS